MPVGARKSDLKLSHMQRVVCKAAVAVSRAADLLLQEKTASHSDEEFRHCTDAIGLLGHVNKELSMRRRFALRPHVNKNLSRIFDDSVPITGWLFGDNFASTLKEAKETEKMGADVAPEKRSFSHSGNFRSYDSGRKGAFLGHSRGFHSHRPPFNSYRGQAQKRQFRPKSNQSSYHAQAQNQ